MEAIEVVDDLPVVDLDRCIGCGLCVTGCDVDAMGLERRQESPRTPESMRALGAQVLSTRGKLEDFLNA